MVSVCPRQLQQLHPGSFTGAASLPSRLNTRRIGWAKLSAAAPRKDSLHWLTQRFKALNCACVLTGKHEAMRKKPKIDWLTQFDRVCHYVPVAFRVLLWIVSVRCGNVASTWNIQLDALIVASSFVVEKSHRNLMKMCEHCKRCCNLVNFELRKNGGSKVKNDIIKTNKQADRRIKIDLIYLIAQYSNRNRL